MSTLTRVTGRPDWWLVDTQAEQEATREKEPTTNGKPVGGGAESVPTPAAPGGRGPIWVVLGSLAALVVIRFFTETVPVVPRAANVIDVPIFFLLAGVALVWRRPGDPLGRTPRWILGLSAVFMAFVVIATLANPSRVELGPVVVFVYATLSPVVVYAAVRRVWPVGNAGAALRVLIVLGLIELAIAGFYNLPRVLASHNPDDLTGTFGTNAYQFVFFMLVFVSALAGVSVQMRGTRLARWAPLLIFAALALMVVAQYRALLPTTALTLLLLAILLGRTSRRGLAVGLGGIVVLSAFLAYAAKDLPFLKLSQTFDQDPVTLVSKRLQITDQLTKLYADEPRFAVTGTGPGTYSSRAWQTFATAASTSTSNVVGPYALTVTGGQTYHTDVSDKYVRPLLATAPIAGSYAVTTPYSSYISIAAEVGVLGMLAFAALFLGGLLTALSRTTLLIDRRESSPLVPLLLASAVAFFVLLQMGALQSWMETTRMTFIAWILLAIATKEYDARFRQSSASAG
jgi:hypothetical protein